MQSPQSMEQLSKPSQNYGHKSNVFKWLGIIVVIIILIVMAVVFFARSILIKTQKVVTVVSPPTMATSPTPTLPPFIKISDVWKQGTQTALSSKRDLTFLYPTYFTVKENLQTTAIESTSFSYPYDDDNLPPQAITPTPESDSIPFLCKNSMEVDVTEIDNPNNLPLSSFVDTKNAQQTNIPKQGSYLVIGGTEDPDWIRDVYFSYNSTIYDFTAKANVCETAEGLTDDELTLFNNMLKSIQFTGQNPTISPTEEIPPTNVVGPGQACGGNTKVAPQCQPGYHCAERPGQKIPAGDVGGICVAD